jgi:hypothetical protein
MRAKPGVPQGWMSKAERKWLQGQAKNVRGLAIEVGSWRGRSTVAIVAGLSHSTGTLYAVDTWAGPPDKGGQADIYDGQGDVYAEFLANLAAPIRAGTVIPLRMDSMQGAAEIERLHGLGCADFIFIDADHRYEAVHADILAYLPLLRVGGVICGHDYRDKFPGVIQAVNELLPGAKIGADSIWARP